MRKKFWKKYGKLVAAAVFLTVAGFGYGFARLQPETVRLDDAGRVISEKTVESGGKNSVDSSTKRNVEFDGKSGTESENVGEKSEKAEQSETGEIPVLTCYVHICGEVKNPGVYELPEGSRMFQVLEKAGGFTPEAAETSLNLAEPIADGMQIVVLSKEEALQAAETAEEEASGRVNINKASKEQLMTLPGIGESRAEDILRYREESGGFQKIEDIMKVSGIKDAAFQKIKDSITV